MRRSLTHFWRTHLAVILAAAVTSAVLTGALLVGDSVRGSLRDLTLERLGRIDHAVVSESFFRQALAEDLARAPDFDRSFADAVPAILLQGTMIHPETGARASRVSVQGVTEYFIDLFPPTGSGLDFAMGTGQLHPSVLVNQSLLEELGAEAGEEILLALERPSDVPRESLLGSTEPTEVVESVRLTIAGALPNRDLGRFGLAPHQAVPLNAFLSLADLQAILEQPDRINAVLLSEAAAAADTDPRSALQEILQGTIALDDLGLEARERPDYLQLESREIILKPQLAQSILALANQRGAAALPILTYLANTMEVGSRGEGDTAAMVPYSTITALPTDQAEPSGRLLLLDGSPAPALAEDEILLNEWAVRDLDAAVGEEVQISYYEVGAREELITRRESFTLRGVVALEGLGADPGLTPELPGVHDADDISEWNPPFPVDLGLIRSRDEDYWDRYGATPKAYVALETGRRLWTSRFGSLTSIRLGAPPGAEVSDMLEALKTELPERLDPQRVGFAVQAVKRQGLEAASGAINLGLYFLYFSFFLIVSAALLVALFFRLGVEQRGREVGLLLALGYPVRSVRRRFLAEGALLGGAGTLLGLAGAVLYAAAMMAGLRSWWQGAVGTPFLFLHVEPLSLVLGFAGALLVVVLSITRTVGRLGRLPAVGLLRGDVGASRQAAGSRRAKIAAVVFLALALVLLAVSATLGLASSTVLFFGIGGSLLGAGLAAFGIWMHQPGEAELRRGGASAVLRMAAKNAALNPSRSLLSGALVASACFVVVAVGANGLRFGEEVRRKESGAGGFTLVAESDVPLHHDLNREAGRDELGFSDRASELLAGAEIVPFRLRPGEDVSCLNLYQPQSPRLLGVPRQQLDRGGFPFLKTLSQPGAGESPWSLLWHDADSDVVPAFGDAHSMQYILKLKLGQDLVMENELGEPLRLRLVGLLRRSLFQSELLISEENLLRHFPSHSGYSYFLIDAPQGKVEETSQILERTLVRHGYDVQSTAQKLQSYQAVENTYLATFQSLGGLGLLLGTVGLAVILLRNIIERRSELATLRALGFPRRRLAWIVVAENWVLLVVGLGIGTLSALVAVTPHLLETDALVPWGALAATLLLIFVVGTLASTAAVSRALRAPLLPALKEE